MATIIQQRGLARFLVCLFIWFLIAKFDISSWTAEIEEENSSENEHHRITQFESEEEREQMRIFLLISEHCLPKLVCELYARAPGLMTFTDSEKSLMSLIGSSSLSAMKSSKYHFAAHFGQLVQGYEGQGCFNLYPLCPFSGEDIQKIASKVPLR